MFHFDVGFQCLLVRAVCSIKAKEAHPRKLIWVEEHNGEAPGCSQCAWVFCSSSPTTGETMDVMRRNFRAQRSKEFAAHDCTKHPKGKAAKASS